MSFTRRRALIVATALSISALISGCAQPSTGVAPVPTEETLWWATGDSIFAGAQTYFGAPSYMNNIFNASRAGGTITQISLNGVPQPTVQDRFEHLIGRWGVPQRVLVHAGAADILVRAVHPQGARHVNAESIVAAATDFDAWLHQIGVEEVMWVTITPHTEWAATAPLDGMRRATNAGYLDAFPGRVINCETAITGSETRRWMKREFEVFDGVHLNNLGARALAACLAEPLGLTTRG